MDWRMKLKEKFKDRISPRTTQSLIFWEATEALARSPLNRPVWKADSVAVTYFLRQTRQAFLQKRPVVWASLLFPSELIHAAGATPFFPEMFAAAASSVELAPRFLDRAQADGFSGDACSFHRVILGSYLEGFLPTPRVIASVNYLCDSAPLSFQAISLQEGVPYLLPEIPYEADAGSLACLAEQLEEAGAVIAHSCGLTKVEYDRNLREALTTSNAARRAMREVEELRRAHPFLLDGREALGHLIMVASSFGHAAGVDFYEGLAREMRKKVAGNGGDSNGSKRLLWMHLKPYYPHSLFDYIERYGGRIVCEEFNCCYWDELDPDSPYESLARKLSGHFGVGPGERRVERIVELARSYRVDGAVHFSHWGCRQSTGGAVLIKEALRREGVPTLLLESECIDNREYQDGQVSTRLEAFLESI
jgi:benzoyl-CoA reductase/2-hydroxyglutaryl-CoA dehydratase subunit BcrC/BadD/HgdB